VDLCTFDLLNPQLLMRILFLLIFSFYIFESEAQTEQSQNRISPKEFSIPASPVFDLMGVTPSQINRTSDIKDFKVDWSFKSWKLNPNLAIQSQPIWEIFYNRSDLSKYQNASLFMRKLASLDLSIGTVQNENNDRRIGYALKVNLIRERDPLMFRELYVDIGEKYTIENEELQLKLKNLNHQLDTTSNLLAKPEIRTQIYSTQDQLLSINSRRNAEINDRVKIVTGEHWNSSSLDIAFGRANSYQTDSVGTFKSLRLNRSTGISGWINGNIGIGKHLLLSGLIRSSWYQEQLDFILRDNISGNEVNQNAIADNTIISSGINLRYGDPYFTFFAEFFYEQKGLKTPIEALNQAFKTPSGFTVVGNSVKWDIVRPNTIGFGGDWRLNRSVMLNYGMRCLFDKNWKLTAFIPVASIACMMR
jgi:hypothetical protein